MAVSREEMDKYADEIKDLLVDDFAALSKLIIERDYIGTSVFMSRMGQSMIQLSQAFAMEALARRLDEIVDKPDDI